MIRYFVRMGALIAAVVGFWYYTKEGKVFLKANAFFSFRHGINLAYIGTFLAIFSLVYMLRKYRVFKLGRIRIWLDAHVFVGALGLFLILIHANYEFAVWVPSILTWSMIIIGLSGIFGWHIFLTSAKSLVDDVGALKENDEIILSTMTSQAFRFWHDIHFIATLVAFAFVIAHVVSIFVFRGRF